MSQSLRCGRNRGNYRLSLAGLALAGSSCALVSSYIADSGVEIETIATRSARIVSAGFWQDGERLSLRGEAVSNPVSKSPLGGHLDIEIVEPGQSGTTCLTTRTRTGARQVTKQYSLPLVELPKPGSIVRVWHDPSRTHSGCAPGRPPLTQNYGSGV